MPAGPVEPWHPPSMFGATTNHSSVSIGAPGPTMSPHQPAVGCPGPGGSAHVAVAGEGVQHEDGVVARRVELAPRLVGEAVAGELAARPRCGTRRRRRSAGRRPGRRRATHRSRAGGRAAAGRRPPSRVPTAPCLRRSASPSVHSRGSGSGAAGRVTRRARHAPGRAPADDAGMPRDAGLRQRGRRGAPTDAPARGAEASAVRGGVRRERPPRRDARPRAPARGRP